MRFSSPTLGLRYAEQLRRTFQLRWIFVRSRPYVRRVHIPRDSQHPIIYICLHALHNIQYSLSSLFFYSELLLHLPPTYWNISISSDASSLPQTSNINRYTHYYKYFMHNLRTGKQKHPQIRINTFQNDYRMKEDYHIRFYFVTQNYNLFRYIYPVTEYNLGTMTPIFGH